MRAATFLRSITRVSDIDEHLSQSQSGTASYYNQDAINSVTSLSNSAGALVGTYSYDSFGKLVSSTGNQAPFQFTGREFDQETGLYYHRARYYDPAHGRFLNEDPLQFEGGLNFYAYADNNPTNETDPFGLRSTYQCTITGVCWKRPNPHPECGWLDPGCFRYHGNWCGPTWTGGRVESYNPDHESLYKPPDDALDSACENHDKCYYHCRKDHPCDKEARKQCMIQCDRVLAGEAATAGHQYSSPLWWWMEHSPTEDPGSNESCGCKEKQGGSK